MGWAASVVKPGQRTYRHLRASAPVWEGTETLKLAIETIAKMNSIPAYEKNLPNTAGADNFILWMAYKEAKALIQFDKPEQTPERELLPTTKQN
jgi:hypothetical protein